MMKDSTGPDPNLQKFLRALALDDDVFNDYHKYIRQNEAEFKRFLKTHDLSDPIIELFLEKDITKLRPKIKIHLSGEITALWVFLWPTLPPSGEDQLNER